MASVTSGKNGRPATAAMNGIRSDGKSVRNNMPLIEFAEDADYEEIKAQLTSNEAQRILEGFVRMEAEAREKGRGRYFTKLDLRELRTLCEAEGNSLIYDREVAKLRDQGEPVPIMLTIRQVRIEEGKTEGYGDTIQAYGTGGMAKRSAEEARLSRNALGLNKQSRAKIVEEIKQEDWIGTDVDPEAMTDAELDAALAEEAGNVISFLKGKAAR